MRRAFLPALLLLPLAVSSCKFPFFGGARDKGDLPPFDENRAFERIHEYEKAGPAIPGSKESLQTGDWIVRELKAAGLEVIEQKTKVLAFDKKEIPVRNLIAQINPGAKVRYLLSAHWDARPFADEDPDPKNRLKPVPAVNDGGSGVVVLLGIADALKERKIPFGVDLVFLDAEDGGKPANELSYCLGTQYFAKNPIPAGYQARFGINFDMVGRIGATFPIEAYSLNRAGAVVSKIRAAAKGLGYQDYFPEYRVGPIIDDHLYLMEGLGFPVADLIQMTEDNHFPPEWHTVKDTSEVISRTTLKVVGLTTLKVLWDEE